MYTCINVYSFLLCFFHVCKYAHIYMNKKQQHVYIWYFLIGVF